MFKLNNYRYLCGTTGHTCSSGDWRQAYANFLVKYVKLYAAAGYNITHLGFLNEPDFEPSYSQMQISDNAQEAISFIPTLYKAVRSAGLSTKIVCCDATGWNKQSQYTTALVNAGSTKYLDVITSHSYSSDAKSPLSQTSRPKWNTEGGPGSIDYTTTWYSSGAANEGFTWAQKLAAAMIDAKLSAYLFWEGFEVGQPKSSSHLLDALDGKTVTPSGIYWAFAMWSRYIRPGAYRVSTSGTVASVSVGAFQNSDKSVVLLFTNSGSATQKVKASFNGFTPKKSAAYITNNSGKFASTNSQLSGGAVTISVPSKSVVTVKLS